MATLAWKPLLHYLQTCGEKTPQARQSELKQFEEVIGHSTSIDELRTNIESLVNALNSYNIFIPRAKAAIIILTLLTLFVTCLTVQAVCYGRSPESVKIYFEKIAFGVNTLLLFALGSICFYFYSLESSQGLRFFNRERSGSQDLKKLLESAMIRLEASLQTVGQLVPSAVQNTDSVTVVMDSDSATILMS